MGFEIAVFNKTHFVWQESLLTSLHPSLGLFLVSNPVIYYFFFIEIFTYRDSSVTVLQSAFKTKFVSGTFNMAKLINNTYNNFNVCEGGESREVYACKLTFGPPQFLFELNNHVTQTHFWSENPLLVHLH